MRYRNEQFADRLNILIEKSRKMGSQPIFVTQPSRKYRFNKQGTLEGVSEIFEYNGIKHNGVDYYFMLREMYDVMLSVGKEHSVLCIDIAKENIWENDDFYDFAHMTPKGANKLGILLFNELSVIYNK